MVCVHSKCIGIMHHTQVRTKNRDLAIFWRDRQYFFIKQKAEWLVGMGIPRQMTDPLALCTQEVTTNGMYRLPHTTHTNSQAYQLAVSRMRSSPRVCISQEQL